MTTVKDRDVDEFPAGTWVRTPSGKVGSVLKSRGSESKKDHFERIVVWFGGGPRDTVVLQPHLLERLPGKPVDTEIRILDIAGA